METTSAQQTVLDEIYAFTKATGRWPYGKTLRLELYRKHKIKLEDVASELGTSFITCNDVSSPSSLCILHLPALRYIADAAGDRDLAGRVVAWLVDKYVREQASDLTPSLAATELEVEDNAIQRVLGYLRYIGGLIQQERLFANEVLGCETFAISDDVLDFDGVTTYDGIFDVLDKRAVRSQ